MLALSSILRRRWSVPPPTGLRVKRHRKSASQTAEDRANIVVVDTDHVDFKQVLRAIPQHAVSIALLGRKTDAHEVLAAGADLILHKPVFSEWAPGVPAARIICQEAAARTIIADVNERSRLRYREGRPTFKNRPTCLILIRALPAPYAPSPRV